jgi:hypothetical protein
MAFLIRFFAYALYGIPQGLLCLRQNQPCFIAYAAKPQMLHGLSFAREIFIL